MLVFRSAVGIWTFTPPLPSDVPPKAAIAEGLRHGTLTAFGSAALQSEPTGPPDAVDQWPLVVAPGFCQPSFSSSDVEKFPPSMPAVGTVARSKPVSST